MITFLKLSNQTLVLIRHREHAYEKPFCRQINGSRMNGFFYLLICFMMSHVFADYALRAGFLGFDKKSQGALFLHGILHGSVAYLICAQWQSWHIVIFIGMAHFLIDFFKMKYRYSFLTDQWFHFFSLIGLAALFSMPNNISLSDYRMMYAREMLVLIGLFAVTTGTGIFLRREFPDFMRIAHPVLTGFGYGSVWDRYLQRLFVFFLILLNCPTGVVFLVMASNAIVLYTARGEKRGVRCILLGASLNYLVAIPASISIKILMIAVSAQGCVL